MHAKGTPCPHGTPGAYGFRRNLWILGWHGICMELRLAWNLHESYITLDSIGSILITMGSVGSLVTLESF